jgi:predicted RNA-binding protein YlqC (UPF0109 family)
MAAPWRERGEGDVEGEDMKMTDQEKDIASSIGWFYMRTEDDRPFESCKVAVKAIKMLGITEIKCEKCLENTQIHIKLHRPGLLIGKDGKNIQALKVYLSDYFEEAFSIIIEEDHLEAYLFEFTYAFADLETL